MWADGLVVTETGTEARAARIQEANCRSSLLAGNDIQPEFLSGLADAIMEA